MQDFAELQKQVIEKGEESKDRTKIPLRICKECPHDGHLDLQIAYDIQTGYVYFDALAMWLGQAQDGVWNKEEQDYLIELAKYYLTLTI